MADNAQISGLEFEIKGSADKAKNSVDDLRDSLSGLKKVAKSGTGLDKAAKEAKDFGTSVAESSTTVKQSSSGIKEAGKAAENLGHKISSAKPAITQLSQKLGGTLLKSAKKATGGMASFAKSIVFAPFENAAESVKNFATKLASVGSAFRRILFYRAIRSVIREIGDAFKYGVNNLYAWSNAFGGEFARSMDSISTSFAYFKNSVGAAVAPLINALAPAIDFVIDKAVALLNVINQLFARLSGATYWTRATKQATAYGDAAGSAGSAAKEALRYLAPFDELNVLPSDSGSGGGGGGGGSSGGNGLFEEMVQFDQSIVDFAQMIKDAWDKNDWQEVGTYIGNKLNDLIENKIPWATLGTNFGKGINAIIGTEYWTLETTNFVNLGDKLAEFVNNAIADIDFDIAGRLPVRKLTAIIDTIIGFLEGLDWWRIGDSIGSFVRGSLSEITEWFNDKDWEQMGEDLINNVVALFDGLDVVECAKSFGRFMEAVIKAGWNLAVGAITAIGGKISEAFQNAFESEDGVNFTYLANGQAFQFDSNEWQNRVENAVTASNIMLDVKANITDVNDALTKDKKVIDKMTAQLRYRRYDNSFDRNLYGLNAMLRYRKYDTGFDRNLYGLNAMLRYRKYDTGFDKTLYGLRGSISRVSRDWSGAPWIDARASLISISRDWSGSPWIDGKANFTNYYRDWSGAPWIDGKLNILSASGYGTLQISNSLYGKTGGVFMNGKKYPIQQFASGGNPTGGQMFIAREAGPELVGTLKGHTAVMNNDQIVASVSAGVARAISNIEFHMNGAMQAPQSYYIDDTAQFDEEMLYRAFVRALSDSDLGGDTYLDGEVLYRNMARRNRQNTRRTGVNEFA